MDRNDAVIGQMVDRMVTNTVQSGFKVDPRTGDKALDEDLKARWNDWSGDPDQCDAAGEATWWEKERATLRAMAIDGDVFHLPTEDGTLQTIEADRCRTPMKTTRRVVHGVLIDDMRRREEYWFTREPRDPLSRLDLVSDIERYPVRNSSGHRQVFHVYSPKRVTQTRGVTWLAPVFDVCGMFEDLQFAALVKQQMSAAVAWFLERDSSVQYMGDLKVGERSTELLEDGDSATVEGISPGMFVRGRPGEKLTTHAPNVPGEAFMAHTKLLLTLIGINIGMPLMLVMLDGSDSNLSQWRGTFEQAKLGFRDNQQLVTGKLHSPTWRWKVQQWASLPASRGGLGETARKIGQNLYRHVWHPPTWPYVQPLDDAKADAMRIQTGLASPRQVAAENGRDHDDLVRENAEDRALEVRAAVEEAKKLQAEGVDVSWRELMPSRAGTAGDGQDSGATARGAAAGANAGADGGGVENVKAEMDAYGTAVRAGVVSPQSQDEEHFRKRLRLPGMSEDVRAAWDRDDGVRRPITLTPPATEQQNTPQPAGAAATTAAESDTDGAGDTEEDEDTDG